MAKKTEDALVAAAPTALAEVPQDLIEDKGKGTESITKDDVRPPRLVLAQSGNPQVKRSDPKHIEGLQEGYLFNDLTQEIYGDDPLKFVVVSRLGDRYIQFDKLGNVLDYDVPKGDARTKFTTGDDGSRVKPAASRFEDYLIWLTDRQELVAISFKGMSLKAAITLNSLISLPLKIGTQVLADPPSWARQFELTARPDKKDSYNYYVLAVRQLGIASVEDRAIARSLNAKFANVNVVIERDAPQTDGEHVPF
jgi:hypothetical protein